MKSVHWLLGSLSLILLLSSCEPQSYSDYALPEYDGSLNWNRLVKSAEWENRQDHKVVVFQDELYLLGGYTPGNVKGDAYFEDVWKSSDGKSWQEINGNAPWQGRRGHDVVVFDDGTGEAMYLIGGFASNEENGVRSYNNDVWKSTDGVNWDQIKPTIDSGNRDSTNWMPRMNHRCLVANHGGTNYIYLLGGFSLESGRKAVYATRYFSDVWRSTDGISWERVQSTDYGLRAEHSATVSPSGELFIQGGMYGWSHNDEENEDKPLAESNYVWRSLDGITWTAEANTDVLSEGYMARADHETLYYRDRLWVLPGKSTNPEHYGFASPENFPIWTYDGGTNWVLDSEGTAIDARHGYAAVVFDDKIFVFGGFTNRNGQSNDVWTAEF